MESQRNELLKLVAEKGWTAKRTDNFEAHEWSIETWELESLWSPVGVKAFVTFPIDEQIHGERKPWAIRVTASPAPYIEQLTDYFEASLTQWKNKKHDLVTFLDRIRIDAKTD